MYCSECDALIKAIDDYIKKVNDKLKKKLKQQGYKNVDETISFSEQLENEIVAIYDNETKYFLKLLKKSENIEDFFNNQWNWFKGTDFIDNFLYQVFSAKLSDILKILTKNYFNDIDSELQLIKKGITTDRQEQWIREHSTRLGEWMKINSTKQLETILTDGISNGKGVKEIAQDIQNDGIRETGWQARRVALTETLRAHSVAQQEAYSQNPAVDRKEWHHTGAGSKPRSNHQDMSGQIVQKNKPFKMIGIDGITYYPMFPRDPILPASESVNCHCLMRPIVRDEVLGLTIEERTKLQQESLETIDDNWKKSNKKGHSAGTDNTISEKDKPVHLKTIDFKNENGIINVLNEFESQAKNLSYEANCVVTSDGKVWALKGTSGYVYSELIETQKNGSSLRGSYSYHNHPKNETNFSFSADDVAFFLHYQEQCSIASDYKYRYIMKRTSKTARNIDFNKIVSKFKSLFRNEILNLSITKEDFDIDEDGYHEVIKLLSKEYKFDYEREIINVKHQS